MRSRQRTLQDVYFCDVSEELVGMENVKTYSKPIKKRLSVSATSGTWYQFGFGISNAYDRYITCFDRSFIPNEGTMCYVDNVPELDKDGNIVMHEIYEEDDDGNTVYDEDGNPVIYAYQPTVLPDYMIQKIYNTKKGHVARFAIRKQGGTG